MSDHTFLKFPQPYATTITQIPLTLNSQSQFLNMPSKLLQR